MRMLDELELMLLDHCDGSAEVIGPGYVQTRCLENPIDFSISEWCHWPRGPRTREEISQWIRDLIDDGVKVRGLKADPKIPDLWIRDYNA